MTLRADAWEDWIAGAYFRAYALHKEPRRLDLADALLQDLQRQSEMRIPSKVLTKRIRRLRGRVLIWRGESKGRDEILGVLQDIGGVSPSIGRNDKELARLASDLCSDLSYIGEHDAAISLATRIAERPVEDQELVASRLANLASWINQRAVAHRAANARAAAVSDLDLAAAKIEQALILRHDIKHDLEHDQSVELRECQEIDLSIRIERSASVSSDLSHEIEEMRRLLRDTPDLEGTEETPLQFAYRVGRLGVAHMRNRSTPRTDRATNLIVAQAYLQFAWESSSNVLLRPWLALDLCEALRKGRQLTALRLVAEASLVRLVPQCGDDYPVNQRLREYVDVASS